MSETESQVPSETEAAQSQAATEDFQMVDMENPSTTMMEILTAMANGQIAPETMPPFQLYGPGHPDSSPTSTMLP